VVGCGLHSSGTGVDLVVGVCELINETLDSIKETGIVFNLTIYFYFLQPPFYIYIYIVYICIYIYIYCPSLKADIHSASPEIPLTNISSFCRIQKLTCRLCTHAHIHIYNISHLEGSCTILALYA
jgi:hypothetical protein